MGCWNATCGVSHLPIEYGDKIATTALIIEPIKQDYLGGGFSYPFEMANPMSIFFFGKYNDYGGVELDLSAVDQQLYSDLVRAIEEDGGLANSLPDDNPDMFFNELVERSETSYDGSPVCIYHIRYDIFRRLVDYTKALPYNSYRGDDTTEDVFRKELRGIFNKDSNSFGMQGAINYQMGYFKVHGVFLRLITNVRQRNNPVYTEYAIDRLIELFVFNTALSNLRMHWSPQSGAGSQDSDVDIHAELIDVMADEIDRIKSKYAEDEEE